MNRIATHRDPQFMSRIPVELHERLKEAAAASGRSMNSELIVRLESSFDPSSRMGIPPLDAELSRIINAHVEREVAARLRAIAANLSGVSA